jgi:cell division protein FtsQ
VEDARVRTSFPDSASIEIRERTPVAAMMGADGQARVIDVDGRVLALVDGQPVALVWISGPGTLDVAPGQFASIGYSAAASLVNKLTPDIRSRVDSMLVTPDGADLVLVLTSEAGPIEVRFGSALGENAQIEKLVRLQRTLEDVGTKPVTVIDVSTSEVTVR